MICFHFTIFVVLETTNGVNRCIKVPLWFAFILLSLSYWKQRTKSCLSRPCCCDLLSFYYLCRTGNNTWTSGSVLGLVVICFHFTIFVVLETTGNFATGTLSGCDLLSFYYLCRTGNNQGAQNAISPIVVICFHFTIFVVLETTRRLATDLLPRLWFAFILLSLSYWKQLFFLPGVWRARCDLLSFYYLCRTGNNEPRFGIRDILLWFAFILLSLSYWKQRKQLKTKLFHGCDLLSFYYLCRTGNNQLHIKQRVFGLWFAFILLSLSYWKQLNVARKFYEYSCDLLSFYYLCRTGNNNRTTNSSPTPVVICFHFTIFVVLETTAERGRVWHPMLWFAFILLSLSYWKQLKRCILFNH